MTARKAGWLLVTLAAAGLVAVGALGLWQQGRSAASYIEGGEGLGPVKGDTGGGDGGGGRQVAELRALLTNLAVDPPRKHKNMWVFPIRWTGKQAPGEWTTLDEATAAGNLKVLEKDQASVPEVRMENVGTKTVLILSGEIIAGGKQTRVARKDAILEPKQQVAMAVFCVEQSRWAGGAEFKGAKNMVPMSIQQGLMSGAADQSYVWQRASELNAENAAAPATGSLDEGLNSPKALERKAEAHKDIGKMSPPDTIGLAVADARTGRVVGLELFGRRDLFEKLQAKLVEGYALDLVPADTPWKEADATAVTEKDVQAFITRVRGGTNKYEETPGGGRGIDLVIGTIRGKGVSEGDSVIHISIQDVKPVVRPVRPIVTPPIIREPPIRRDPPVRPMPYEDVPMPR
jgi:hypothetical protein